MLIHIFCDLSILERVCCVRKGSTEDPKSEMEWGEGGRVELCATEKDVEKRRAKKHCQFGQKIVLIYL